MALVLASNGVVSNSNTWLGWWIEREEGWHTYWEHPGNVGLTPNLDWELPDGFKVESFISISQACTNGRGKGLWPQRKTLTLLK